MRDPFDLADQRRLFLPHLLREAGDMSELRVQASADDHGFAAA
jgi:hypothetical protein